MITIALFQILLIWTTFSRSVIGEIDVPKRKTRSTPIKLNSVDINENLEEKADIEVVTSNIKPTDEIENTRTFSDQSNLEATKESAAKLTPIDETTIVIEEVKETEQSKTKNREVENNAAINVEEELTHELVEQGTHDDIKYTEENVAVAEKALHDTTTAEEIIPEPEVADSKAAHHSETEEVPTESHQQRQEMLNQQEDQPGTREVNLETSSLSAEKIEGKQESIEEIKEEKEEELPEEIVDVKAADIEEKKAEKEELKIEETAEMKESEAEANEVNQVSLEEKVVEFSALRGSLEKVEAKSTQTADKEEEAVQVESDHTGVEEAINIQDSLKTFRAGHQDLELHSLDIQVEATPTAEPTNAGGTEMPTSTPSSAPSNLIQNEELIDGFTTDLITATLSGSTSAVESVLITLGVAQATANNLGFTSLVTAIFKGFNSLAQVLIEKTSMNLDSKGVAGNTPLMFAALWGNEEMVEYLLVAGADVGLTNNKSETALALAAKGGFRDIVSLLREYGAVK